jgi:hypothetical protein
MFVDEIARILLLSWRASFCIEILCKDATSDDGESQRVFNDELQIV